MKEPNNTSWEALEKAWQKQIQDQEAKVPSDMWGRIDERLNEKPVRPMWTRVRLSPWTWSAAAVIALVIGINWESNKPTEKQTVRKTEIEIPKSTEPSNMPLQVGDERIVTQVPERIAKLPTSVPAAAVEPVIILPDQEPPVVVQAEVKPEQAEEIWVRIDINPAEEIAKPMVVAQQDEPKLTKRKTFIGRLLKQVRQVAAGEQLNWQELKEGNRPLEDGIHQVANTYYRTEQSIKQTLQIQ